jgi:alkaline phosphatase D
VHLGDYIYEYASDASSGDDTYGDVRPYEPTGEIKTLADYRTRHGYYKRTDPDLQRLHSLLPFITIWDDHESADNAYKDGASNHTANDGVWVQRRSWSEQAYDEWMPIRLPERGNPKKIWRRLQYGTLADMMLLDTRLWARTLQAQTPILPTDTVSSPTRELLGAEQKAWLKARLEESTAKWKLIANQVVFHQWIILPGTVAPAGLPAPFNALATITAPQALNGDAWDAYTAERTELINHLRTKSINNAVILTGDVHSSWVADINDDPNNPMAYNPTNGDGSVAAEFVVTSVTSPGLPIPDQVVQAIRVSSPHIKYVNMSGKGYSILKLTNAKVVCEYWYVDTIATRTGGQTLAATFEVADGQNRITASSVLPAP